jgi:hypothetical protein
MLFAIELPFVPLIQESERSFLCAEDPNVAREARKRKVGITKVVDHCTMEDGAKAPAKIPHYSTPHSSQMGISSRDQLTSGPGS